MEETMSKRKQGRRGNGFGNVRLKGNTYYCRWTDALGNRQEVSCHTSNYQEALKVLAKHTDPIRESKSHEEIKLRLQQEIDVLDLRKEMRDVGRVALDELVAKFMSHRDLADATEGTKKAYRGYLNALVAELKKKFPSAKNVDDVTLNVADAVMGELTKTYTASTYNLALAAYRRCWRLFARTNPFAKISKRKVDKSRHRIQVTDDDVRRIFKACRDDVERAVWGVGIYTGLRSIDVCNLTYGALGKGLSTITWTPIKTRKHMAEPLVIPVCETLRGLLTKVLDWSKIGDEGAKDTLLWPDYKRRHDVGICEWFGKTLERAGLQTSHIDKEGHRTVDTGFHITRHYFISTAGRYMSPLLVQKIAGHSTLEMTSNYFHCDKDELVAGVEKMPNLLAEGTVERARRTEADEVMELLASVKRAGEGVLDCLKRLLENDARMAS